MLKKLQSISKFVEINASEMKNVTGGVYDVLQMGESTGGGTNPVSTSVSASGCASYDSDTIMYSGRTGRVAQVIRHYNGDV